MKYSSFANMRPTAYLFYSMLHPSDGFQEMKYNKKGSPLLMCVILVLWAAEELFTRIFTDYDLNGYSGADESLFRVAIITFLTFLIAVAANWCFCTLLDGKGRMIDIAVVGAYSLTPYILVRYLIIVISHFTTNSVESFLNYAVMAAILWSFVMIFAGLQVIHEYSAWMTLASLVLTVVGILIIMFIGLIAVQLYQQIMTFASTIIMELQYS